MKKQLVRSSTDKKISGVCGGIGDYLNIDSTLVRIAFVLFTFAGGFGLLLYIIAILLMPMDYEVTTDPLQNTTYAKASGAYENTASTAQKNAEGNLEDGVTFEDEEASAQNTQQANPSAKNPYFADSKASAKTARPPSVITGIVLVAIGLIFLAKIFFPHFNFSILFAAGIVAIGILFITRGGK